MTKPSETERKQNPTQAAIVNDFCITFSTINGSGSATANTTLMRALFRMGIPVSGKNIFPSNIQGQPTWYSLRINKDGYVGRVERDDIVVAMNPATIANEAHYIKPGGVLLYADDLALPEMREDVILYPMPVKQLVKEAEIAPNLRDYIANMVYVGVVAQVFGIELDEIYHALDVHFKGKKKAIDSNFSMVKAAAEWAEANITKRDPYKVERMKATDGYIMTDGNTAAALGAIYGGIQFVGWYPITPATSLTESLNEYLPLLRVDPETGKNTFAVVQSEDELAAIGMTIGAAWGGLRAMTSTSGPGLSLMAEYLGMAYYAEIPVVVWDVQRVGPSTGLPTRTGQCDITFGNYISHGDKNMVMLFPNSVDECYEFGWKALDLAERLQTPILVMSDLDLGMNQWMTKKFEFPATPIDRGKVVWEEDLTKMLEKGAWGRYLDIDGDGIPYRTVMGNQHPRSAYMTRGTGHDEFAKYSEDPIVWERFLNRFKVKFETAKKYIPHPVKRSLGATKIGMIAFGSVDPAAIEAQDLLAKNGIQIDYLRIRATPFTSEVEDFLKEHDRIYVVELNRDGQMKQLLSVEYPQLAGRLIQAAHMDGMPMSAKWIVSEVTAHEEK